MATTFVGTPEPKDTLLVALRTGKVYLVDFENLDISDPADTNLTSPLLIVGKIQLNRTRNLTLEEIECETVTSATTAAVHTSLDGKTVQPQINLAPPANSDNHSSWKCHTTARNLAVSFKGYYNINTITLTFHNHGKR